MMSAKRVGAKGAGVGRRVAAVPFGAILIAASLFATVGCGPSPAERNVDWSLSNILIAARGMATTELQDTTTLTGFRPEYRALPPPSAEQLWPVPPLAYFDRTTSGSSVTYAIFVSATANIGAPPTYSSHAKYGCISLHATIGAPDSVTFTDRPCPEYVVTWVNDTTEPYYYEPIRLIDYLPDDTAP